MERTVLVQTKHQDVLGFCVTSLRVNECETSMNCFVGDLQKGDIHHLLREVEGFEVGVLQRRR